MFVFFFSCKEKDCYFLEVQFSMLKQNCLQMSFPPRISRPESFAPLHYGFHTPMAMLNTVPMQLWQIPFLTNSILDMCWEQQTCCSIPCTDPLLLVFPLSGAKARFQLQMRGPNPQRQRKPMAYKGNSFKVSELQKTKLPFYRSLFTRCML